MIETAEEAEVEVGAGRDILAADMTIYGFLCHMQSRARELAALDFERAAAGGPPEAESPSRTAIRESWEVLREELPELCGFCLKPFGELAAPGKPITEFIPTNGWNQPHSCTFGAAKIKADKLRRSRPEFRFLRSWDPEQHPPKPKEERW